MAHSVCTTQPNSQGGRKTPLTREAELPEALPTPVFAEAVIDEDVMVASSAERPAMIIDLPHGKRLSIFAAAPPALVAAALKGLR